MQEPPILTRDHLSDCALQENRDFPQEHVLQSLKQLLQVQRATERYLDQIRWFVVAILVILTLLLIFSLLTMSVGTEIRGTIYSF